MLFRTFTEDNENSLCSLEGHTIVQSRWSLHANAIVSKYITNLCTSLSSREPAFASHTVGYYTVDDIHQ